MQIEGLNHVVLLSRDLEASVAFYQDALGMWTVKRGGVTSMHFGGAASVLVADEHDLNPRPSTTANGATNVCLLASGSISEWRTRIENAGHTLETGPVARLAAEGAVRSIYLRDPDGNLIELAFAAGQHARDVHAARR